MPYCSLWNKTISKLTKNMYITAVKMLPSLTLKRKRYLAFATRRASKAWKSETFKTHAWNFIQIYEAISGPTLRIGKYVLTIYILETQSSVIKSNSLYELIAVAHLQFLLIFAVGPRHSVVIIDLFHSPICYSLLSSILLTEFRA